jgi:hypothetical protein
MTFYYLSEVERSFYRRIIRVSIFFLCLGLLLGLAGGYTYKALDSRYREEKMQQTLAQKRDKIADLESALGIKQGKGKPKSTINGRKIP